MALLNRVYDYELLCAIRAGSEGVEDARNQNTRYRFSPDWEAEDQRAFFLCFWIFQRMEDREAYYHEYVRFLLRHESREQITAQYLKRVIPVKNPAAIVLAAEMARDKSLIRGPIEIGPKDTYLL